MTCRKILECIHSKPRAPTVHEQLERTCEAVSEGGLSKSKLKLSGAAGENQFEVEDMDMLYASWSKTVRIDRQTLLSWGGEIKEVEIETVKGKKKRCKVEPVEVAKKGVVQVPDKMQIHLVIRKGELVMVKPVNKKAQVPPWSKILIDRSRSAFSNPLSVASLVMRKKKKKIV